jgi:Lrp/AsnC family transcriptional regulator, leucine-responsive regulatory protein
MANALDSEKLLDPIGWRILAELQEDARMQYAELGRRVGLSNPAVIERVRRMEETGIITGYRAEINYRKVGLRVPAYIRVRVAGDYIPRFISAVRNVSEVFECHRISGEDTFLVKVYAASSEDLERIVDNLNPYVATNTMLVFSSPVTRRTVLSPEETITAPAIKKKKKAGDRSDRSR